MLKYRSFPRYDVQAYHFTFKFPEIENHESIKITAVDASLGGLKLHSSEKVDFSNLGQLMIGYRKYQFNLKIKEIYNIKKNQHFVCGLSISFEQKEDFKYWFLFIKSLHQIFLKSKK